jgi:REP-associated tyrosine transposase
MLSVVGVTLRTNANIAFQCVSRGVVPEVPQVGDWWAHGGTAEGDHRRGDRREGAWLIEMETTPDHVHLLVEVDPQFAIHKLVKPIKGRSSRLLRQESWLRSRLPPLWTNSYFVANVGGASLSVITRDVENQKSR